MRTRSEEVQSEPISLAWSLRRRRLKPSPLGSVRTVASPPGLLRCGSLGLHGFIDRWRRRVFGKGFVVAALAVIFGFYRFFFLFFEKGFYRFDVPYFWDFFFFFFF